MKNTLKKLARLALTAAGIMMVAVALTALGTRTGNAASGTDVNVINSWLPVSNTADAPLHVRNVDYANAFSTTAYWSISPANSIGQADFSPPIPPGKRMVVEHISVYTEASSERSAPRIQLAIIDAMMHPHLDFLGVAGPRNAWSAEMAVRTFSSETGLVSVTYAPSTAGANGYVRMTGYLIDI